jgi:hypothetical protein
MVSLKYQEVRTHFVLPISLTEYIRGRRTGLKTEYVIRSMKGHQQSTVTAVDEKHHTL